MSKSVKKSKTPFRLSDLTPGEVIAIKLWCANAGAGDWKVHAEDYMHNWGRGYTAKLIDAAIKRAVKSALDKEYDKSIRYGSVWR